MRIPFVLGSLLLSAFAWGAVAPAPSAPAGGVNVGASEGNSHSITSGNPGTEMERARSTTVKFEPGSAELTAEAKAALAAHLNDIGRAGLVEVVRVAAWGDEAAAPGKASDQDRDLARARAAAVENAVKEWRSTVKISAHDMTQDAALFQKIVNGPDRRLKRSLKRTGLSDDRALHASSAMVFVVLTN
jgi:hypothetical protein